jgi:hypothetical protein
MGLKFILIYAYIKMGSNQSHLTEWFYIMVIRRKNIEHIKEKSSISLKTMFSPKDCYNRLGIKNIN